MKAKLLAKLNNEELRSYKQSLLYQKFVLSSYQYTDKSIEYYDEYFNHEYANYSIIVFDDAQVPLLALYAFTKQPIFSYFGLPVPVIESSFSSVSEKNKAYKELIMKLNEIFYSEHFEELKFYDNDYLCAAYFLKISKNEIEYNSYIDLNLSEQQIKTNIRKSYKSLVNWGEKNLEFSLINCDNPDYSKFLSFKNFHIATAGRKTRSDRSWDLQFESIKLNEAYLILGYLSDKIVSSSLIMYGKNEAYYGVGVYDRELMSKNVAVGHYNILLAIYHAKKIGLKSINLGFIMNDAEDEKEKNIFRFKSGFSNSLEVKNRYTVNLKSKL